MTSDERLALVMRIGHMHGDPAPGSTKTVCDSCGEEVWIAPATIQAQKAGMVTGLRCCCCANTHNDGEFLRLMLSEDMHFHDFVEGMCGCGANEADWLKVPQEVREFHDFLGELRKRIRP